MNVLIFLHNKKETRFSVCERDDIAAKYR